MHGVVPASGAGTADFAASSIVPLGAFRVSVALVPNEYAGEALNTNSPVLVECCGGSLHPRGGARNRLDLLLG